MTSHHAMYQRLDLPIEATPLQVVRRAAREYSRNDRRDPLQREARHLFYFKMLQHHKSAQSTASRVARIFW